MQLCYVVPSQPQTDDMVDVAAVLSRWHLLVLHEGGSRALWRARVFDLTLRSEGNFEGLGGKTLRLTSLLHLPSLCQSQTVTTEHNSAVSKHLLAAD